MELRQFPPTNTWPISFVIGQAIVLYCLAVMFVYVSPWTRARHRDHHQMKVVVKCIPRSPIEWASLSRMIRSHHRVTTTVIFPHFRQDHSKVKSVTKRQFSTSASVTEQLVKRSLQAHVYGPTISCITISTVGNRLGNATVIRKAQSQHLNTIYLMDK